MSSLNNSFVLYFFLLVVASFVCAPVLSDSGGIVPVLVAGYFMLVAVNAIGRGENSAKKTRSKKR